MTIPQTTVAADLTKAVEGQLIVAPEGGLITVVDPDVDQTFGRAVEWDTATNDNEVKVPAASGVLAGIVVFSHAFANRELTSPKGIPAKTPFTIVRRGLLWVFAEEAVAPGDAVFYRFASGAGGSELGRFRNDADTATAAQINNARFRTSTSAAGLVQLELNLVA